MPFCFMGGNDKMQKIVAVLLITCISLVCLSPRVALADLPNMPAFNTMLGIGLAGLVTTLVLTWGRWAEKPPKEEKNLEMLGGIVGGIIGMLAFFQDSSLQGAYSVGFIIGLPLYALMGIASGAEIGIATYYGYRKIVPLEEQIVEIMTVEAKSITISSEAR